MRQDGKIELQCCNSKIVGGGDWGIMGKVISPAEETGDIRRQEQTISNTTEPVCSGNHTKKTALEWRARSSMIIHDLSSLKATVFSSLRRTRATSFWQVAAWMQRRSKKPLGPGMSWTYYLTIRTVRLPGTLQITKASGELREHGTGETRWMLKPFSQIRGWQSYRFAQTKTSLWSRSIMECSKQCDRRQDWLHPYP